MLTTDTKRSSDGEDPADAPPEKRQKMDPTEPEHAAAEAAEVRDQSKGNFLCASKVVWTEAEVGTLQ